VIAGKVFILKSGKPVVGNRVKRRAFSGNSLKAAFTLPDALIGGNPVADNHDGKFFVLQTVVITKPFAVFRSKPVY
jgi:hypothetical protein